MKGGSTLADVARAAGVSTRTVVNVLEARRPVRADTRHRVVAAVSQLGYRPDPVARTLRRGSPDTLVLLVPAEGYDELAELLVEAATAAGCPAVEEVAAVTAGQRCLLVVRCP